MTTNEMIEKLADIIETERNVISHDERKAIEKILEILSNYNKAIQNLLDQNKDLFDRAVKYDDKLIKIHQIIEDNPDVTCRELKYLISEKGE